MSFPTNINLDIDYTEALTRLYDRLSSHMAKHELCLPSKKSTSTTRVNCDDYFCTTNPDEVDWSNNIYVLGDTNGDGFSGGIFGFFSPINGSEAEIALSISFSLCERFNFESLSSSKCFSLSS